METTDNTKRNIALTAIDTYHAYESLEQRARKSIEDALRDIVKATDAKSVEFGQLSPIVTCSSSFVDDSASERIRSVGVDECDEVVLVTDHGEYGCDDIPMTSDLYDILTAVTDLD